MGNKSHIVQKLISAFIFLSLGMVMAVITQNLVIQPSHNIHKDCLEKGLYAVGHGDLSDCSEIVKETRGWPFPSVRVSHNGNREPINAQNCVNPFEIFCDKNPNAVRYKIHQLYFNALFLSIAIWIIFRIIKKIRGTSENHRH